MERKQALAWFKRNWRVLTLCGGCLAAGFFAGMVFFGSPWHLPPAWGDIPTWITAIATVGLLAGAMITAIYAIRAFRAQAQELSDQAEMLRIQSDQLAEQRRINEKQTGVLELQAADLRESLEERKREAEQRHRAQASQVFIQQWRSRTAPHGHPEPEDAQAAVHATVINSSGQPIYDVELRWHLGSAGYGDPEIEPLGAIMPSFDRDSMRWFPPRADMSNSGAVVRFTDASGTRWLRRPDGYLNESHQA